MSRVTCQNGTTTGEDAVHMFTVLRHGFSHGPLRQMQKIDVLFAQMSEDALGETQ
jgi:hypothetical protein